MFLTGKKKKNSLIFSRYRPVFPYHFRLDAQPPAALPRKQFAERPWRSRGRPKRGGHVQSSPNPSSGCSASSGSKIALTRVSSVTNSSIRMSASSTRPRPFSGSGSDSRRAGCCRRSRTACRRPRPSRHRPSVLAGPAAGTVRSAAYR